MVVRLVLGPAPVIGPGRPGAVVEAVSLRPVGCFIPNKYNRLKRLGNVLLANYSRYGYYTCMWDKNTQLLFNHYLEPCKR